jgi:hypothetical protein
MDFEPNWQASLLCPHNNASGVPEAMLFTVSRLIVWCCVVFVSTDAGLRRKGITLVMPFWQELLKIFLNWFLFAEIDAFAQI